MPIVVTNPTVLKPKKPRHTSSTPRAHKAHAPAVKHVRAAKAPHAPHVTHARSTTRKGNLTPAEISTGQSDNAAELAALNGGYYGTQAQGTAGNTYTGSFDQYGLPNGAGSGRQGLHVRTAHFANFQAYMKSLTPILNKYRAALPGGGTTAPVAHSSGKTTATPHVPAVHTPKVTAPLALTDAGLLGHDSHITRPRALSPIAPVTMRHPGH